MKQISTYSVANVPILGEVDGWNERPTDDTENFHRVVRSFAISHVPCVNLGSSRGPHFIFATRAEFLNCKTHVSGLVYRLLFDSTTKS